MHVPVILFNRIKGHSVRIVCQSFVKDTKETYEGKVIGDANTGYDMFIELDTGDLINVKYIEAIKIIN